MKRIYYFFKYWGRKWEDTRINMKTAWELAGVIIND